MKPLLTKKLGIKYRRFSSPTMATENDTSPVSGNVLKGLLTCRVCDCVMVPTSDNNHALVYRYYACNNHIKTRTCRSIMKIVPAEEIESRVVQEVWKKIRTSEVIMNIYELNKIEKKLSQNDIKALVDSVLDVWNALHPKEQRKIVRLLIARIDLHESHMDLEINLDGFNRLLLEFNENA